VVDELKKWNFTLSNSLVKLRGRVLPLEKIVSNKESYNADQSANWTACLRYLPMFTCVNIKHWVILAPSTCLTEVQMFSNSLISTAQGMSFKLPRPIM